MVKGTMQNTNTLKKNKKQTLSDCYGGQEVASVQG